MKVKEYINYSNFETNRLIIRFLNENDATAIYHLQSNEANQKYLNRPKMDSIEKATKYIQDKNEGIAENKYLYWGICVDDIDEVIGTICLWSFQENPKRADVGYELLPEFQGRGIMDEALKKVIDIGFDTLFLERIEACTHENNSSSIRLLEKNNFSFVKALSKEEKEESEQDDELFIFALENKTKEK